MVVSVGQLTCARTRGDRDSAPQGPEVVACERQSTNALKCRTASGSVLELLCRHTVPAARWRNHKASSGLSVPRALMMRASINLLYEPSGSKEDLQPRADIVPGNVVTHIHSSQR